MKAGDKVVWLDPAHETSHITTIIRQINKPKNDKFIVYLCSNGTTELECLGRELATIPDTICCIDCGCIDIEIQSWVRATTLQQTDLIESDECWCPKCDSKTWSVNLETYLKNKEQDENNNRNNR